MATLLLLIIYLAFISLGLPDSLLGAGWPVMQKDLGQSLDSAGLLYMIIAGGTIVSSLANGWLNKWLDAGKITLISVLMTAAALWGYSIAPSMAWLIVCSIPLGLGAGAVDATLNNVVANHYKAHHMSWLHCFWGVGAMSSPIIMSYFILQQGSWRDGYLSVAIIQFGLTAVLLISLPLWSKLRPTTHAEEKENHSSSHTVDLENSVPTKPLQVKGVKVGLLSFLFYCGVESMMGLWGSSYLVNSKGLSVATAAQWVSLFYGGLTLGRFLSGFITLKVSNTMLIRAGQLTALFGTIILVLPLPTLFSCLGYVLIGLGLAPIYPCLLHETPARYGKKHSQSIMGYQMAVAYTGSTFLPPLFGVVATQFSTGIFPYVALLFAGVMLLSSEMLNRMLYNHKQTMTKLR
ncbi:MFS transporter [Paenibacillus sp. N1-5-1-14]|uniref:MFS transporter n=1 Tax=Paenibacillus radicibacter TaxID=2972488 RepID=UPI00215912B6|nr:MFS transporter [Paenibacillus radicibacter]MCR8645378.1 MFS transporter [Paenibacillus radicibacter]